MSAEAEILERLRTDTPFYASHCLQIVNKRAQMVPLQPRRAQLKLDAALEEQRAAGLPMRAIVLKSRKVGISTWVQGKLLQRATQRPNRRALVVAQDNETAGDLFEIGYGMYVNLPPDPEIRPQLAQQRNSKGGEKYMRWGQRAVAARETGDLGLNSTLDISSAKEVESGRGKTITDLHCCLTGDAPVILEDGRVVPIRDVTVGSRVLTHTGAPATVTAMSAGRPSERNGGGRTVKLTPWLGGEVELTPNHKVWTQRGWVQAGKLTLEDRVAMPVREVTHGMLYLTLPDAPVRRQGGGRRSVGAGALLELGEEAGFGFGYYLAEGSLGRNKGKPAQVTFTRHRGEAAYAQRAADAFAGLHTSRHVNDRADTLTTTETLYGTPLACLIEREFGTCGDKRVPDWVFDAGEGFLRGLLAGYLSGDGSKTNDDAQGYETARVAATTICSSLATQMRDVAAALGYGWASIRRKPAGVQYGRNCREAWVVTWSGRAARALRPLMGLEAPDTGRERAEKAEIRDGMVWMRLRSIEAGETDRVYDLEVDHSDHSFRTLHFAVSNSEVAFWPDARKALSLLNAVPDEPETLIVLESTANGHNFFKARWDAAVRGDGGFVAVFIGWTEDEDCQRAFQSPEAREAFIRTIGEGPWGADEPRLVEKFGATPEQLNWRRYTIVDKCDGKLDSFNQEYPNEAQDAFIGSGKLVFSSFFVRQVHDRVAHTAALPPHQGGPQKGLLLPAGTRKRELAYSTMEVPTGALWTPKAATGFGESHPWWTLFEHPVKGPSDEVPDAKPGQYVIGVDAAGDEEATSTGDRAYHAIQVIDHRTRMQVASWRGRMDPDLVAREAFLAGMYFNEALIAVEITGGWGIPIAKPLWKGYGYRRVYMRKTVESKKEKTQDRLGWSTDRRTKPLMEAGMHEALREGTDGIRCQMTAHELDTYVKDDRGNHGPDTDCFSDLLIAYMIAQTLAAQEPIRQMSGLGTFNTMTRKVPR